MSKQKKKHPNKKTKKNFDALASSLRHNLRRRKQPKPSAS